jgi:hypothetical protein
MKKKDRPLLRYFLVNKLRRMSYSWPPRKEAIKRARVSRGKYKCATCEGQDFGPKDIQVDHIIPVINPHTGFTDWNDFIERLFCGVEGFSVKCKVCHDAKTLTENFIRKEVKKEQEPDNGDI